MKGQIHCRERKHLCLLGFWEPLGLEGFGSWCWDGESLRKQSPSCCQKLTSLGKGQAHQNLTERKLCRQFPLVSF